MIGGLIEFAGADGEITVFDDRSGGIDVEWYDRRVFTIDDEDALELAEALVKVVEQRMNRALLDEVNAQVNAQLRAVRAILLAV